MGGDDMARRDVRGNWQLRQTNGFVVDVSIPFVNTDGSFPVTATHTNGSVRGSGFGRVGGDIAGDDFQFRVGWSNGTEGAYIGVFDTGGVINGSTFDVQNPSSTAGW